MTARASNCELCTKWTGTIPCEAGHRPRFYVPRSPYDDSWGWKRKCADFDTVTYTRGELDDARAVADELAQNCGEIMPTKPLELTRPMQTSERLTKEQDAMFKPGGFVMLHPESKHPDAGRVGKIVSRNGDEMLVEFFNDELIGKTDFSTIPLGHWGPVPEFFVEEYEPRAKKIGWRVAERGMRMFRNLGWGYTAATEGKA